MAEQEPDGMEPDAELGGGMLSQSELDALLAAVEEEHPGGDPAHEPEGWAEGAAQADALPDLEHANAPGIVELPLFDLPGGGGGHGAGASAPGSSSMSRVRDIPLEVTVELGRTRLLIRDILDLGAGSIIELDKLAGEPVDLFANGLLVARGEVIVIDDNFGVRVTEIITAAERRQIQDAEATVLAA
jgi:flagellar motor switch protein FliN